MANAFNGYLIKNNLTGASKVIEKYIKLDTYKSTPNQREEIEAYRDDYTRDLTRVTATGRKTSITFETIEGLNLNEKIEMQNFFNTAMTNTAERKVNLTYWNDEENVYKSSYFYIANVQFPIREIVGNDIIYGSCTFDLVEY